MYASDRQRSDASLMNLSVALVEAQRCLQCYDAPCTQKCPVHINVPGFIKRLAEDNLIGSNQLLVERNPLATLCGLVCPTLQFCEGACVLPHMGQTPIRIGALQYFVASQCQSPEVIGKNRAPRRIAVVGAGPSGLGCAVVLRRLGHSVDLYERGSTLGGLVTGVIPPHRLPQEVASHDLDRIQQLGIAGHLGTNVDADMLKQLIETYDAVFLGIGLSGSESLSVPGSDLPAVSSALELLRLARSLRDRGSLHRLLGDCSVILGGGNVALDAAVTAKRAGVEHVIVLYRRTLEELPGWRSEYLEAASLGVEFRWLSTIRSITARSDGGVTLQVQPMRRTGAQNEGRRVVEPDPDSPNYELPCHSVLLALGQSLEGEWVKELGVQLSAGGTILADAETFQTSELKLFAAGEAVAGGSTVVESLAQGVAAGRAMDRWLQEERGREAS